MSRKKRSATSSNGSIDSVNGDKNSEKHENNIVTRLKNKVIIRAKDEKQCNAIKSIGENQVTVLTGIAGSGKTYIAVSCALKEFLKGKYERMIFTRPCVEANGEKLGYLPGDFNEKISPYMLPIFNILMKFLYKKHIDNLIADGKILTLPLAFQRGISFENSFCILDESQNTVPSQVRMFLTRMSQDSKVDITGDLRQSDIRGKNGLQDICDRMVGVTGLDIIELTEPIRHPLIIEIENRYQ